jgi:hypothetical protein
MKKPMQAVIIRFDSYAQSHALLKGRDSIIKSNSGSKRPAQSEVALWPLESAGRK